MWRFLRIVPSAALVSIVCAAGIFASATIGSSATAASCGNAYEVRPGDTLSHIATRCETSVTALLDANPQITDPRALAVGARLAVPGAKIEAAVDETVAEGPLHLTGTIDNTRRCSVLETPDGRRYGLVSPAFVFVLGEEVSIEAHVVTDRSCNVTPTLLVDRLAPPDATPDGTVVAEVAD